MKNETELLSIVSGGALKHLVIRPRWFMMWSPWAWKTAKKHTRLIQEEGQRVQTEAINRLLGEVDND